ncbi:hypothetical protein LZ31DRAFT_80347 [Colletotrichum somersetense]|nr:hypothetical protein LZ31DRAFT_80347 [Colletotrichum somersetense]
MRRYLRVVNPTLCVRSWPSFHLLSRVRHQLFRQSHKDGGRSSRDTDEALNAQTVGRKRSIMSTTRADPTLDVVRGIEQGERRGSRMGVEDCRDLGSLSSVHTLSCRSYPFTIWTWAHAKEAGQGRQEMPWEGINGKPVPPSLFGQPTASSRVSD